MDEEVSWAIRVHQALRFFPDEVRRLQVPGACTSNCSGRTTSPSPTSTPSTSGADHKWYMTGRLICINDIYTFDPNAKVDLEEFDDIVGRNFKQPKEGPRLRQQPLGPHVAHADVADAPVPVSCSSGGYRFSL